jgi:hypothetical protein
LRTVALMEVDHAVEEFVLDRQGRDPRLVVGRRLSHDAEPADHLARLFRELVFVLGDGLPLLLVLLLLLVLEKLRPLFLGHVVRFGHFDVGPEGDALFGDLAEEGAFLCRRRVGGGAQPSPALEGLGEFYAHVLPLDGQESPEDGCKDGHHVH